VDAKEKELASALDDLILGRGVARGRHSLRHQGRLVRAEMEERLAANGFRPTTVREAPIEAGEKIPAFYLHDETADFGWIRWEIFTPRSRRKLFASEYRRPDNDEWAVQLNLSSPETVWASPERKERHDVDTVVAVHP
jgi:hypothetical protein